MKNFCKYCNGPILLKSKGTRPFIFCGPKCRSSFHYNKTDIITRQSKIADQEKKSVCKICGIEFPLKINRTGTQIFTSNFC